MNDRDERPDQRTLHLPTVVTTRAADELGQLVDEMLASYHGHPVGRVTRPQGDPGGKAGSKPPPVASTGGVPTSGSASGHRRRSTLSFAWHELTAHPLRLAAIVIAAVPVGLGVVHLAGLDHPSDLAGTATKTPPAVTATPHPRPAADHPSALHHAPLVPVPSSPPHRHHHHHQTRSHATHGHGTATPTGHPTRHHPRPSPSPSHSRSHHPPSPTSPDPTDSAPAEHPPTTPEVSPR